MIYFEKINIFSSILWTTIIAAVEIASLTDHISYTSILFNIFHWIWNQLNNPIYLLMNEI